MNARLSDNDLLLELEPVVEKELNRHLRAAKEWFPHDYIPWSDGRNYDGLMEGDPWSADDAGLPEVARTALIVNLLTEDNLPSYHREIAVIFGRDNAWGEWVHRWTAEEGRHGIAMRDYMLVRRLVDPTELERFRMEHMSGGYESTHGDDVLRSLAYVSFQELATRVSHRNTGKVTGDPMCDRLLSRIATDENLHMIFYRNMLKAALDIAPDQTMEAILDVVRHFAMPGADIPGFQRKAMAMAIEGIYDQRLHHDEVVMPVLRYWGVFDTEGLSGSGEVARTELASYMGDLDEAADRFVEKRDALKARLAARG